MLRLASALFALACVLALAPPALAQSSVRVVLATRDPALESALQAALAPWHVALIVLDDVVPGASMPSASDRGSSLARQHDAAAVTWISRDDTGAFALWIYDPSSRHVVARALPMGPPFDEPTADAVALAIKTLLRHSAAAPASERIVDPAPTSMARIEIGVGARALATSPGDVEPRATLAASYWPTELGSLFGVGIAIRGGTGLGVQRPSVVARLGSIDAHVSLRVRATPMPILDVVFGLDLGATISWLDATVVTDAHHTMPVSADPTSYLWIEVGVRPLSMLRVALRGGVFLSPRTRTYLVRGDVVLDMQPAAPFGELLVELPLDGGRVDSP